MIKISELKIKNLSVNIEDKKILEDISFSIKQGEIHIIMGPNGSGKSTIANTIMGNPLFEITKGNIYLDETELNLLDPEERAKLGLFMTFQNPIEIEGISLINFLKASYSSIKEEISLAKFIPILKEKMNGILDFEFAKRNINYGFSGGEKKKTELIQLLLLEPKFAILDETDSGLDIDAIKLIYKTIKEMKKTGFIIITHHINILKHITPDKVHVMKNGKIIKSGTSELIQKIEKDGFKGE